ncbi:MAG: hypothetical protein AW07_00256 [Candidatus Accumulibacter sp. SK-11]|nr:MAG: hypothetical protein AW07_00256 [Candidatus Accumulibacter sp. SK-11]HAY28462.1 hypothetical protein [Accumulibacter sp.]
MIRRLGLPIADGQAATWAHASLAVCASSAPTIIDHRFRFAATAVAKPGGGVLVVEQMTGGRWGMTVESDRAAGRSGAR